MVKPRALGFSYSSDLSRCPSAIRFAYIFYTSHVLAFNNAPTSPFIPSFFDRNLLSTNLSLYQKKVKTLNGIGRETWQSFAKGGTFILLRFIAHIEFLIILEDERGD